ncbi:MAG: hypothetical protein ACJ8F7_06035 [Gemmataceae bacterium]
MDRLHFEQINAGMTRHDVEALLNSVPGDYSTRTVVSTNVSALIVKKASQIAVWRSDYGIIKVGFDDDGRAVWKEFDDVEAINDSWWWRMRQKVKSVL